MGLEVFAFIKDLIAANPSGLDGKVQGDDHIRGLKLTLQNQFPGFTDGIGITATETQLNAAPGTADAANARALACLPKDGSESATGTIRGPGFVAEVAAGGFAVVEAGYVENQRGLKMVCGPAASYLELSGNGGFTAPVMNVSVDGAGNASQVQLGVGGVTLRTSGAPPHQGASDTQLADTAWVRRRSFTAVIVNAPNKGWEGIPKEEKAYIVQLSGQAVCCLHIPGNTITSAGVIVGDRTVFVRVDDAGFHGVSCLTANGGSELPSDITRVLWG